MQIITQLLTIFKTTVKRDGEKIVIQGPTEIPPGHWLSKKKLSRHGIYTRTLLLLNRIKVEIVIFRFLEKLPPGSNKKYRTYSLLPFYISPYQRHINTTIDAVLKMFFCEYKSLFSISNGLDLGISTVSRWVSKFSAEAEDLNVKIELKGIEEKPGYKPAETPSTSIFDIVKSIFKKVFLLSDNEEQLSEYGITSWLNLNFQT